MITKTNEIIFSSEPSNIVLVEKFIDDVFKEVQIKDEMYGNVLVAVSEAVTNAMIHGNKANEAKNVTLGISLPKGNNVCFTIEDEGIGFDPEVVPDPTSPENIEKPNGRGIFLMKHLADKVDFEKNGARVHIEFSF